MYTYVRGSFCKSRVLFLDVLIEKALTYYGSRRAPDVWKRPNMHLQTYTYVQTGRERERERERETERERERERGRERERVVAT